MDADTVAFIADLDLKRDKRSALLLRALGKLTREEWAVVSSFWYTEHEAAGESFTDYATKMARAYR